ncbi:MAG: lipopolysaccharide transport periplasmic protein LptA [Desulfobulbaceae bacterium]|nr:lipopolysaccharide transport periplasmic protein LptA [Desulfobulbaceae bacterium]
MIMKNIIRFLFLFLLTCLSSTSFAAEEKPAADNSNNNMPINIEADRMESMKKENAVIFKGNVDAKQGELIIRSDEMTVYYLSEAEKAAQPAGDARKIKKLFATGNVEINNQGWVATGDNMEYFELERKVLITGNTKVWQDNNLVTGDSVLLYLDEGKSVVERSDKKGERVKAFFYPGGENPNEKK